MADVTVSAYCSRQWIPKGSSAKKMYRARLTTTLNTYDTYCTISYTHQLEINSSVGHNGYHWSVGGTGISGSGTCNTVFNSAKIVTCKSGTSGSVTRTHVEQTISASGSIWATSSGGTNTWNGQVVTATKSYTVPPLESWVVSYDANGGTGTIADDTKWFGEDLVLSDGTGFTRANYTLTGWNTSADGSGTHYDLGETYTSNDGLALYAEWTLNAIVVKTKVGGVWKSGILHIKNGGSWVVPHTGYIKDSGTWKQIT